jgi:pyrroloquinoline quinone biosynthesis protein B
MRVRLLGTAAGGGVPQWNCNCRICGEARAGTGRVRVRTQSSVAISTDERHWFLLNASPDLRGQIEAFPPLQPPAGQMRGSPIQGVLLTNADLDHTLGMLLLREGEKLPVHATESVRLALTEENGFADVMSAFCGVQWVHPPSQLSPLLNRDGSETGLVYRFISLGGRPPKFAKRSLSGPNHVVGYLFVDKKTEGRLLYLPDVPALNDEVKDVLKHCDVLLFDGTFCSEDEMRQRGVGEQTACQMGHLPILGPNGSLQMLEKLKVKNRIYIHINNTNLTLLEGSDERARVEAAGCVVGEDGMELSF